LAIVVTGRWCRRRHAVVTSHHAGCSTSTAATATAAASTAAATNRNDHVRVLGRLAESSEVGSLTSRILVLRRSSSTTFRTGNLARLDGGVLEDERTRVRGARVGRLFGQAVGGGNVGLEDVGEGVVVGLAVVRAAGDGDWRTVHVHFSVAL
jgi:hypothetical protein